MRIFAAAIGIASLLLIGCNGAEEAAVEETEPAVEETMESAEEMAPDTMMMEEAAPDTMMMEEGMPEGEGGMEEETEGGH